MTPNFIECAREQAFLMPPSVRDWLPEDHLAWFILAAAEELDLSAFYADYRDDGHGRPAHDPQMMVALLLYAYAKGQRSSRVIERECTEDVSYRVISANRRPDHTTIARFRQRHEAPLAELFSDVLGLCAEAGLVKTGVVAIDGTKLHANASHHSNRDYEQIAKEILAEASEVDRAEDELYGSRRGDELPPYEAYRAHGVMRDGRRFGAPPKPYKPPERPAGKINTTDPDSRNLKTPRGYMQGYNAQAATNENHIVLAAEITIDSPDFGHLEPMVEAAEAELGKAGVSDSPQVVLADAGYWHQEQMERITSRGTQVIVPPDASKRKGARPGWKGGHYAFMRRVLATERGSELYRKRQGMVEPVFAQTKFNRRMDRFLRRGRSAVRSEWRLINATHNLLKLHRHTLVAAAA